jgi:Tetratricopeptide repeat
VIRRELTVASPDRYRPDLAAALDNLGVRFSELGRPADALPVIEEAVASYRELAAATPTWGLLLCQQDDDRLGQARALQNLGVTKRVQGCMGPLPMISVAPWRTSSGCFINNQTTPRPASALITYIRVPHPRS